MTFELDSKAGTQHKRIAYVVGDFPGKIQTFVLNEMRELSRIGWDIYVCPIHHVKGNVQEGESWKPAGVIYAEPFNMLGILLSHLYFLLSRPVSYLKCLANYRSQGGKRVFWKSAYFARVVKELGIRHVHAHFAWTATDAARVVNRLTNIPFSFTAHAADIYYVPDHLAPKLKEARFVLTCVRNNKTYLSTVFGAVIGEKTKVVYHGVDLETFSPRSATCDKEIDVLSIANLVEKKGHRYLIEACGMLKRKGVSLKCLIVGQGPEKARLLDRIRELGLEACVKIEGKRPQLELPSLYEKSRVFVLPSLITSKGDRDGIPNVLVEAMAMGLPVVSSELPNISELIDHEKDGVLVREKDAAALALSIGNLLEDRKKRDSLGRAARKKIEEQFDAKKHIEKIADIFSQCHTRQ